MTDETVRQCNVCHEVKPLDQFYKDATCRLGRSYKCKACVKIYQANHLDAQSIRQERYENKRTDAGTPFRRVRRLKCLYDLSEAQFLDMFEAQDGACKICHTTFEKHSDAHVDHDHKMGDIRGLLCGKCNRMIGLSNDDPIVLRSAATYLEGGTP